MALIAATEIRKYTMHRTYRTKLEASWEKKAIFNGEVKRTTAQIFQCHLAASSRQK